MVARGLVGGSLILSEKTFRFRRDGRPYLTRYHLLRWPCLGVYVHKFHDSDDPPYHDHPWSFFSVVLWGGYVEHRKEERLLPCERTSRWVFWDVVRRSLSVGYRRATDLHYVRLLRKPTWTLVICFKKFRIWGFHDGGRGS